MTAPMSAPAPTTRPDIGVASRRIRIDCELTLDAELINRALPGARAYIVRSEPSPRSAPGLGYVEARQEGPLRAAWFRYGHPNHGYVRVADDVIILAVVRRAGADAKWNSEEAGEGRGHLYLPGSMHFSSAGESGSDVAVIAFDIDPMTRAVEGLRGRAVGSPPRLLDHEASEALAILRRLRATPPAGGRDHIVADGLRLVSAVLGRVTQSRNHGAGQHDIDYAIVRSVVDYLESRRAWWVPMSRLSAITGYSDRRIQSAFKATLGTPPSRYMRNRALAEARARLSERAAGAPTVTQAALDHGFRHLSRFAASYRELFGELPSATRRR